MKHFAKALADAMSQYWPPDASATALDPSLDNARFATIQVAKFDLTFVKLCVCWDKHVCPWVWHWFSQDELDQLMVSVRGVCESLSRMTTTDRCEADIVDEIVWMIGRAKNRMRKESEFVGTVRILVGKYPSLRNALRAIRRDEAKCLHTTAADQARAMATNERRL
ncbi:hypothetical protein BCR44DRAFT_1012194 [Catenaria anguillulae PL171]|uniref:Uncharacterized protein n=1 Tax=Catenaria anguillulae PL171 TaxID=765915 RepID=A0A1Y2I6R8_9FUNG|nr:hypothetical protein BCR44DRAFT_1012194 [Catenaria anguillulae PL171]